MKTILVTGATGRVGSELVKLLVSKGESVRAATRDPSHQRFPRSVASAAFDFDDPTTFGPALDGIGRLFLIARPADNQSDIAAIPLIDEAKKRGVSLIVNLTAMGVEQDESFMLRTLERYVESSGISFVHLRPNWFMQNFDSGPIYADIYATRTIHLPAGDAKLSFIDVRDIAAAACRALTENCYEGTGYTLTGGEALSHFAVAEKLSAAAGSPISYVPVSEEAARAGLVARHIPTDHIERWTDFFAKVRKGLCAPVSTDLERILGRQPISFDQYTKDYARSWRP